MSKPVFCRIIGLLAVLLFRLWMLALTSLTGMMVMSYTGLALLGRWTLMDGATVVSAKVGLLNGVVISGMLAGIAVMTYVGLMLSQAMITEHRFVAWNGAPRAA